MTDITDSIKSLWNALPFSGSDGPLVTVLPLCGVIGSPAAGTGRRGMSLMRLEKAVQAAFAPANLAAVVLAVNSPGGSPVQSRLIYRAIRQQAEEKGIPVLSFIEDAGASGGYLLALAGDEIYADASSVVGSVGVISAGFGLHEAIGRIGVERRIHTAGENKSMLDPFRPVNEKDSARLQEILDDLHLQFVDIVKMRRGEKLSGEEDIFSGLFWTGRQAVEKGLVDGTAQYGDFLKSRYGKNVRIKRIRINRESLLKRVLSGDGMPEARSPSVPCTLPDPGALIEALESRAVWSRYGL